MNYFKKTNKDGTIELLENPIVGNHENLEEITKEEFDILLEEKNKPTPLDRTNEIDARLLEIEQLSQRPLKSIKVAELQGLEPNQFDVNKLIVLETESEQLRAERRGLNG